MHGDALPPAPGRFCNSCGASAEANDRFCQVCGAPLVTEFSDTMPIDSAARRSRLSRNALLIILAIVVLVLSGTVAVLVLTRTGGPTAVTLEPISTSSANPFMPPVGTDQPGVIPLPSSGGSSPGNTVGLYGGTQQQGSCNPQQMIDFLNGHPDEATAWASVLGIQPTDIAGYVATLTPVLLRSDLAVTNHGFTNGHATSFPAVLQAGTAVLADRSMTLP
jgi:hypothetical protein